MCLIMSGACVDDYTEYNPPHALDAPFLRASTSGSNQILVSTPLNPYQNTLKSYIGLGTSVEFTVSVVDAPGKINTVSVAPSVPDFGSVTLNEASVTALKGKEQGEFRFTYTANPDLAEGDDRPLNIVITVTDSQEGSNKQTTTLTIAAVVGSPCFSRALQTGNYLVTQASGNRDGGDPYTLDSLQLALHSRVVVSIAEERPGVYTITEVTGGVWPVYYSGRAVPELQVDVCGNTITSRTGYATTSPGTAVARTFTINGTVNNDNTVDITWSYVRDDGATPIDPAKGSYKLNLIRLGM